MEEPKNKFEYWTEVLFLLILLVLASMAVVWGSYSCTAYHPCPEWSQIVIVLGASMLNVALDLILFLVLVPAIIKKAREYSN